MSKNFTAKTSPKWILWSVITAVIALAGIIVMALAGVNSAAHMKSGEALIVNVSMSRTFYEDEKETIQTMTEQAIADAGLKIVDSYEGEKSLQVHELVYTFAPKTNLSAVKAALQADLTEEYPTYNVTVMSSSNTVLETLPGGYVNFVLRSVAAGVVMALLASAYICLRYKLWNGIVAFISAAASGALTAALVVLTRVVATSATVYTVFFSMLLSLGLSVLFAAKNKKAEKENGTALTDSEALSEAVPVCDTAKICGGLMAVVVVLGVVGLFTAANFAWFALASVFAIVSAAYASVVLAPSVFLPIRTAFAKVEAERARYDYKKGKKSKKNEQPKVEAVVETEEK